MKGENMNIAAKTVDESRVETVYIVRPNHLNGANRLFGGILMQWIDEVAGIVAKRHSMGNVTTASVDNLTFLHGAYQNEMVVIKGKLTWVGTSSMEVCVDTYVENHLGERRRINNAHSFYAGFIYGFRFYIHMISFHHSGGEESSSI